MEADPVWPVLVLAVVTAADGIACLGPIPFIREALDRVDCPEPVRKALPWVKFAATIGLVMGLWVPVLGLITSGCLVAYFAIATWMHIRARDEVTNTLGAVLMGVVVVFVSLSFT